MSKAQAAAVQREAPVVGIVGGGIGGLALVSDPSNAAMFVSFLSRA